MTNKFAFIATETTRRDLIQTIAIPIGTKFGVGVFLASIGHTFSAQTKRSSRTIVTTRSAIGIVIQQCGTGSVATII